ncbi:MAG: CaiB/BaiF CoA transferase family protein [Tuberibacillus sp.]
MLEGIRVIDFTQYLPGPFATLRLADRGAEVIKVEPLAGDPARSMGSSVFSANNRNKKSIALNLKDTEGQSLALELIAHADVVVESFRPGVMKRLGLDYNSVSPVNEKIIYVSMTGFGQEGAMTALGSHDLNYLGLSGMLSQMTDTQAKPIHPSITLADLIGGLACSEAIASALYRREATGRGVFIDLSIMDAIFSMMTTHVMIAGTTGSGRGVPALTGNFVHYHIYETKDGRYMSLSALEYKFWNHFCMAVGHSEWLEAFPNNLSVGTPLYQEMKRLFLTRTQKEWTKLGEEADCCLFPILETDEAVSSQYIRERQLIQEIDGKPYVRTHHTSNIPPDGAMALGEHTQYILQKILNKSEKHIRKLRELGVII